jgi:4-amino-4-deoxy-L-arabinose transferase-like glycosyltransferase
VALCYRLFGQHDIFGRLVVIAFSLGLIAAVSRLATLLDGRAAVGRAAAFLVAVSPAAVFFGRTLMPDTPMLFFVVLALIGFVEYGRQGSTRWLIIGAASFGLACLVKIPAVCVAPALAAAVLQGRGWPALRDRRVWLAAVLPLVVAGAWYWHAHEIYDRTGLTFGILGAPAKTYPAYVSTGPWPSVFSKWSTVALLTDVGFYERMLARIYHFVLLPTGFVLAAIGAASWRAAGRTIPGVWLATLLLFLLVAGEGNRAHDYYQLPFVAVGAIYFGRIAWPLFDGGWIRATLGDGPVRAGAFAALVAALGVASFYYSSVTQTHFRSGALDVRLEQAGRAIDAQTDDRALAVVVDDYGVTSPLLLYFARLKGWSFDTGDLSPQLIERLRRFGARYVATTQWSQIAERKPETAAWLERCPEIQLTQPPGDTRLFELRCPQ